MGNLAAAKRRFPQLEHLLQAALSVLTTLVASALLLTSSWVAGPVSSARATVPGADAVELIWDTGNRVYYGNYNTPIFTTVDTQGKVSFAYCVDPSTTVPNAGSYRTIPLEEFCPTVADRVRAAMWFSYGGPGFDPSMWPSTWIDGTPMNAAKYYAAGHLVVAYEVTQNLGWTYYGSGAAFVKYAAETFMGLDNFGRVKNANSTRDQIVARASEVPASYTCYMLDCGRWDFTQYIIAQDYYEQPQLYPNVALVQKVDSELGSQMPQGAATLAGAQFEVCFYEGTFTERDLPGTPTRSWVFATDEQGSVVYDDAHLVGGDALYRDASGTPALPLGTVAVHEAVAPNGYLLPNGGWSLVATTTELVSESASTLRTMSNDAPRPIDVLVGIFAPRAALADEAPVETVVSEQVIRGGVRAYKVDAQTGGAQGDATLEGTEFSIVSLNSGPVLVDGAIYSYGQVVKVMYTNADGVAETGAYDLPYGVYTVEETNPPGGYMRSTQHVTISENGVIVEVGTPFENDVKRGGIRVTKVDADLGSGQAQGAATLEGTLFTITNASAQAVLVNGVSYEPGEVVATISSNAAGVAQTGAYDLPYGTYTVTETAAPVGYRAGDGSVQTVVVSENGAMHDVALAFENPVMRGGISIAKVDAGTASATPQGAASLAGATFEIANANANPVVVGGIAYQPGEVVITLVTGEDGLAATASDALPYGSYTVTETIAPEGYLLSNQVQSIQVLQDGVTVAATPFANEVQRGGFGLRKFDAETLEATPQGGASLAGATFDVVNANTNPVIVGGVTYQPGETVTSIVTNEDGWAQTGNHDLPYGTYSVVEAGAPNGYHIGIPGTEQDALVAVIDAEWSWQSYEAHVYDQVIRGGITVIKTDAQLASEAQGAATLEGAEFSVTNASSHAVIVDGTVYQPGDVVATLVTDAGGHASTGARSLPYGTYTVAETTAPVGYIASSATQSISVNEEGVVVETAPFANEVIRGGVSVQKLDAEIGTQGPQGAASYQGAVFEIRNANDAPVSVNGQVYETGSVVATVTTNESGHATTGAFALPYGTYYVKETLAPKGYLVNPTQWEVVIQDDGIVVKAGSTPSEPVPSEQPEEAGFIDTVLALFSPSRAEASEAESEAYIPEHVMRGDVCGVKREEGSEAPMPRVVFKVTSLSTGESHLLATNEAGVFSTASSHVPHSYGTNGNDSALAHNGSLDEALIDPSRGIWFSGSPYTVAQPNDSAGALPFDTYTFEELSSSANRGHALVNFEVSVRENGQVIDLGTVYNGVLEDPGETLPETGDPGPLRNVGALAVVGVGLTFVAVVVLAIVIRQHALDQNEWNLERGTNPW